MSYGMKVILKSVNVFLWRILKYALSCKKYFQIKGDLKDVAISPTGRFIMVSTVTTTVFIYTLKGMCLSFRVPLIHNCGEHFLKLVLNCCVSGPKLLRASVN